MVDSPFVKYAKASYRAKKAARTRRIREFANEENWYHQVKRFHAEMEKNGTRKAVIKVQKDAPRRKDRPASAPRGCRVRSLFSRGNVRARGNQT